jgi:ubiquinone/menaquinone biosynthesis C-methylase UbiE
MSETNRTFADEQRAFFSEADVEHFRWQTTNPLISRTERELLAGFRPRRSSRVLEVGCGEGGNIANLLPDLEHVGLLVGADLYLAKLRFACATTDRAQFVCGDALSLPFRSGAFDAVLCRDVLHHLEHREIAVRELRRVCKPGGEVWIIEPNGRNPLMRLLALLRPHERGLLSNSPATLHRLLSAEFSDVRLDSSQPLPIYRLLLHYQCGFPRFGLSRSVARAMRLWDRALGRILPRGLWAYIVARAVR